MALGIAEILDRLPDQSTDAARDRGRPEVQLVLEFLKGAVAEEQDQFRERRLDFRLLFVASQLFALDSRGWHE
jgi:hypothetical protein